MKLHSNFIIYYVNRKSNMHWYQGKTHQMPTFLHHNTIYKTPQTTASENLNSHTNSGSIHSDRAAPILD